MRSHYKLFVPFLALCFLASSCSDDDDPVTPSEEGFDFSTILQDYSQKVVIATYADLATKAATLNERASAFNANPSDAAISAAATAWIAAREPWEASEAFLFGPAEFLNLDPALDSWPVDRQQLQNVLNSDLDLTPDAIAEGLGPALRGFHTAEFLLFRDGQVRPTADLTEREREYLVAVTKVLSDDAQALLDGWDANGYGNEFASAGQSGSRFISQVDAVLEIVEGIIAISDEVANGKIADPFDQDNTELVESQFSFNSLQDFANNIRSIKNAYRGGFHISNDFGTGLDSFIRESDAALDTKIHSQIDEAIARVQAIPEPFRDNLDAASEIEAAQSAINEIMTIFEDDVKPLIQ